MPVFRNNRVKKRLFVISQAVWLLIGCDGEDANKAPAREEPASSPDSIVDVEHSLNLSCGASGFLTASLSGAIDAELTISSQELTCESMQRPDQEGLRLRFSAAIDDETFAMIVAIPGLIAGDDADELASNITLTVEGSGRFFSTPDLSTCWSDVRQESGPAIGDVRINAEVYCVAALGELNGAAAVSVDALSFSTLASWDTK